MSAPPALTALPPGLVCLADHEAHAQTVLTDNAWAYFSGGAADEFTMRANANAWAKQELLPRVMQALAGGDTRMSLLGRTLQHPLLLAPVAYQRMAHPDGELATAHASAALGAGMVVSTQASVLLESVAQAFLSDPADAHRGPLWFQLYMQPDRGFTRALVERVEAAGYEALVLTADAPVSGARDRERRAGFKLPEGISAVNLAGLKTPHYPELKPHQSALFDRLLTTAPTWADMEWLAAQTRLPILVKGVLHPDDARLAIKFGAAGVIVSNHGGRTLDTTPATASVLPSVVQAVGGDCPVLVDGGIRRGTDVLKAMALGASAVLVGRPYIYGLANAGAVGVAHVLRLLRDELEIAMALCGCPTLAQATPGILFSPSVCGSMRGQHAGRHSS